MTGTSLPAAAGDFRLGTFYPFIVEYWVIGNEADNH